MTRIRHVKDSIRERDALDHIPDHLVLAIEEARESGAPVPLGVRCEVLDEYDRARALGATGASVMEVLGLSSTTLITRWRRQRLGWMSRLGDLLER